MPTKNNISLKPEDIRLVKELRTLIEKDESRYSLAEIIRKCIRYSLNNKVHFEAYNNLHEL